MPATFTVDQAATFAGIAFMSCEPKTEFGNPDVQEKTKDGTPKWEIQLAASFRDNFGKLQNEILKVGYAGHTNPCDGWAPFTPAQLVNLQVGVMEKTARDDRSKILGVQVWYRVEDIRPLTAVPTQTTGKRAAEHAQ